MEKLTVETVVRYHGSIEEAHGEFVIVAVAEEFLGPDEIVRSADDARYVIMKFDGKLHGDYGYLWNVRRQSIMPVKQADAYNVSVNHLDGCDD